MTWERPPLYPEQEAAIFCPQRYGLIEATPKVGKTHGCLIWLIEQALQGTRGAEYWWAAPVSDQALIAFNRLKGMLEPREAYLVNETLKRVTLKPMGAIIAFKSADHPDSLYGEDVHALVIDEGTRVKRPAWIALRTTLTATQAPVRIIGNVKGRKNWMYDLARQAESGQEPDMHFKRLTAEDAIRAGIFPRAELDDARKRMPEPIFRELYYAEAAADEGNPFGETAIARNIMPSVTLGEGEVSWSSGEPVAGWGIDIAETVDWNVVIGLAASGRCASVQRWHGPWGVTKPRILALVGNDPAIADATSLQSLLVQELAAVKPNVTGYKFTSTTKQELVGALLDALQTDRVQYPAGLIPEELRAFEYVYEGTEGRVRVSYRAREGAHDDCVCALALAVIASRGSWAAWDAYMGSHNAHGKPYTDTPGAPKPAVTRTIIRHA